MQVDWRYSNLGKFDLTTCDWIRFELRENKRAILPVLFESGKAKTTFLHKLERFVQALQSILQHLRLYVLEFQNTLFCDSQSILLFVVIWVWRIRWDDIFLSQTTGVDLTFTRFYPVPSFGECIVIDTPTLFHPRKHSRFLGKVWVNSVRVSQTQHTYILTPLSYLLEVLYQFVFV